uniref:F-box protein n=2 Tax=Populus alba TaxID=43335 RepID=A0A4U5PRM6_POPAL|nr:putative F-box protein [Populus alba]
MSLTKLKRSSSQENMHPASVKRQKLFKNKLVSYSPSPSPSWELLFLVAQYLDPKSLATASCVSKSWSESFSFEDIWRPICSAHYPSVYNLKLVETQLSCHRLYGIASTAASKLQLQKPIKPHLPLKDLLFVINASTGETSTLFTLSKPCDELQVDSNGIFRFAVDIDLESSLKKEAIREIKVTWNVVLRGWKAVFIMMESYSGKASLVPEAEDLLFSKELPLPGCCSNMVTASSLVAELKLGFCSENCTDEEEGIEDDGKFKRGELSLAIMNTEHWRYLSMDDALRHLQHFLLPCDA